MLMLDLVEKYSEGATGLRQSIANALPHIFDFDFPMYDEEYRTVLETKIVRHYLTYEFCYDTEDEWKAILETKLNEEMPYYNQRYASTILEINPMYTHYLETTHNAGKTETGADGSSVTLSGTKSETQHHVGNTSESRGDTTQISHSETGTVDNQSHSKTDKDNSHTNNSRKTDGTTVTEQGTSSTTESTGNSNTIRECDTPNGGIQSITDGYLSKATKEDGTGSHTATVTDSKSGSTTGSNILQETIVDDGTDETTATSKDIIAKQQRGSNIVTGETEGSHEDDITINGTNGQTTTASGNRSLTTTDEYINLVKGHSGVSESELILKWRETFINIDKEIVLMLKPIFCLVF